MFGRVPNVFKLSTWQFPIQQRKRFGSVSSLDELGVVPSIVDPILGVVITMGLLHKPWNHGLIIRDPNMFSDFVFDLGDHW